MKKIIKKLIIASSLAGLASVGQAQWSVMNMNDPLYFGPTGIFTRSMGQIMNSVKASVDQVATLSEVSRKQAAQFQQDTDQRLRNALGQSNISNRNAMLYPTLERCAEISAQGMGAGAIAPAYSGGGGGGTGKVKRLPKAAAGITTDTAKLTNSLNNKSAIGTCSELDIASKVKDCSSVGDYGGSSSAPSSDVSPLALKGNTNNTEKVKKDEQEFANLTLSDKEIDVGQQFIANATLYNAPKVLPADKANPSYQSLYDTVMIKLNSAQQAMKDILSMRRAGTLQDGSLAQEYWDKNSDKYKAMFGMKAPKTPSLADLINFQAANDYVGVPDTTLKTTEDLLGAVNKKLALQNMVAVKQLNQQENTNILLSLLLVQAVTPADIGKVNAEYNKFVNGAAPVAK